MENKIKKAINEVYVDGGVVGTINRVLGGSSITNSTAYVLESFAEAVVLYERIILAFNYVHVENIHQVEDYLIPKNVLYKFKTEAYKEIDLSSLKELDSLPNIPKVPSSVKGPGFSRSSFMGAAWNGARDEVAKGIQRIIW